MRKLLILVNCLFLVLTCDLSAKTTPVSALSGKEKIVSKVPEAPIDLTLADAIYLALRNNSTIKSAELSRITQKYSIVVAKHTFEPNYTLTGSFNYAQNTANGPTSYSTTSGLTPAVSIKNRYGTVFTATMTNALGRYYNPSLQLQVLQPLLQGFGREVTEAALKTALDLEEINKLMLKQNVSSTIITIITDYFNWRLADATLKVDQKTLKSYERNIVSDQLKLKMGKIATNDLIQDQAQVANQQVTIEADRNSVTQAKFNLLKDMGLDANTPIQLPKSFNYDDTVKLFKGPYLQEQSLLPLEKCQELAFINDPSYRISEFSLRNAERSLITAQDQMRWQLNLTATETRGNGSGGGVSAGIESLTNARNHAENVGLNLNVPVDTVNLRAGLLNAKVALQQAEISFRDLKRQIEINVFNQRNTTISNYKSLQLNKSSIALQRKMVEIAELKHQYGKISSFELIKDQETLSSSEIQYLQSEVSYLSALRDLNNTLGVILDVWGIKLKDFNHAKID